MCAASFSLAQNLTLAEPTNPRPAGKQCYLMDGAATDGGVNDIL